MCVIVGERLCASAHKCEYMSVSERKSVSVQRAGRAGPTPLRHRVEAAPGRGREQSAPGSQHLESEREPALLPDAGELTPVSSH